MSHLENQMDNMFHSGESERESLIEELETLRASNTIKQANIELLEADIVHLKTEILCLNHERDALLAEREAMMKQEPVSDIDGFLRVCRNNTPLYAGPLPAQQIQYQAACSGLWYESPKACGDIAAIKLDGEIYELSQHIPEGYALVPIEPTEEMLSAASSTFKDGVFESLSLRDPRETYKRMLSASQPKGDL